MEESKTQRRDTLVENSIAPGTFEFQLSHQPSALIFLADGGAVTQQAQHVGRFLASLMPNGRNSRAAFVESGTTADLVEAA